MAKGKRTKVESPPNQSGFRLVGAAELAMTRPDCRPPDPIRAAALQTAWEQLCGLSTKSVIALLPVLGRYVEIGVQRVPEPPMCVDPGYPPDVLKR